jgi:hypothetical protein
MGKISELLETYFMVLVHPFGIHHQFRHNVALPGHEGELHRPLTIAEAIGISWVFAILRGLLKLVLLNFFLQSFLSFQSESFPFLQDLVVSSGISAFYFLLFSAALDIVFFPITALIQTEIWIFIIKRFARWLNPQLPAQEIADQVATHALSSNIIFIVPFIGDGLQAMLHLFLLYAGLRANLGASRALAYVILLTPFLLFFMLMSLLALLLFILFS